MKANAFRRGGFTLIELITVIAIISLLTVLALPEVDRLTNRVRSVACMSNLRQIGVAVGLYAADNEGKMPYINNPARPVYEGDELPDDVQPMTMEEAFAPYDVTGRTLRCPVDALRNNYYEKEGTSYEWRPMADGEPKMAPTIFTRRGALASVKPSRVRIVTDVDAVHSGRMNRLFLDGHIVWVKD